MHPLLLIDQQIYYYGRNILHHYKGIQLHYNTLWHHLLVFHVYIQLHNDHYLHKVFYAIL